MDKKNAEKTRYYALVNSVAEIFRKQWSEALKGVSGKGKTKLTEFMPILYRRWYFSPLITDSILTPANAIIALNKQFGEPECNTLRLIIGYDEKGKAKPEFVVTAFQTDNHPVIEDLRAFLDGAGQQINMGEVTSGANLQSVPRLSLNDRQYFGYVARLAERLKMVSKVPSINTDIYKVNPDWKEFFDSADSVMLKKITEATVDICSSFISELLPVNKSFKQRLMRYMKKPIIVDKIFSEVFKSVGFDAERLFEDIGERVSALEDMMEDYDGSELDFDKFSELPENIIAGTFFLGIMLDKHLLTPMSYYIRAIQPVYLMQCDLEEDMRMILDALMQEVQFDDIESMAYAPCTLYEHTDIGDKIFDAGGKHLCDKLIPDNVPIETIIGMLLKSARNNQRNVFEDKKVETGVYAIKIKTARDKRFWQVVEVTEATTLAGLNFIICRIFGFDADADYSYFIGGDTPFNEYTPQRNKKKHRKTEKTRLTDLELSEKGTFIYRVYNEYEPYEKNAKSPQKEVELVMEILKITTSDRVSAYPKVSRRSKHVVDFMKS